LEPLLAVPVCVFWVLAEDLLVGAGLVGAAPAEVCGLACAAIAVAHVSKSAPAAQNRKVRVPAETLSVNEKSSSGQLSKSKKPNWTLAL
jgi:hypothetical protein